MKDMALKNSYDTVQSFHTIYCEYFYFKTLVNHQGRIKNDINIYREK